MKTGELEVLITQRRIVDLYSHGSPPSRSPLLERVFPILGASEKLYDL